MPKGLRSVLLERLERLEAGDRRLLEAAAAIGRRFDEGVLAAVSGRPLTEIRAALARSCEIQLLEHVGGKGYGFRHALTQEAIYGELIASRARALHRAIGMELERRRPDAPANIDELAYHWWSAGDHRRGSRYNEEAGDRAGSLFAEEQALVYYGRALALLDRGSGAFERVGAKMRTIRARRSTA
jgi:predicted ATPase